MIGHAPNDYRDIHRIHDFLHRGSHFLCCSVVSIRVSALRLHNDQLSSVLLNALLGPGGGIAQNIQERRFCGFRPIG
jgi:hypothetical protein